MFSATSVEKGKLLSTKDSGAIRCDIAGSKCSLSEACQYSNRQASNRDKPPVSDGVISCPSMLLPYWPAAAVRGMSYVRLPSNLTHRELKPVYGP